MVKRLQTSDVSSAAENTFLEEIQMLQLASATCQRTCRMLGCCKLDGDACIVMSLYPKSAAKRLSETEGSFSVQPEVHRVTHECGDTLHQLHVPNFYPLLPLNVQTHGGMPCSARHLLLDNCC